MAQRQPMWSIRVIDGLVQGDEAEMNANFSVIGTDDLPSLATVAVTSFNTRVGDVTFVATDLPTSGVSPGTIDLPTVTVDQYGRVTSIIPSPTVLVQSVTSSGGTLTVTGTTTTNVEIALGHSNSWTAAQKYTAGGKTLQFGASTTTITTDDTSLVLAQTGDTFGTSRLTLENRSGLNGALFETLGASADLVDFGFQPNTGSSVKRNLRMDNRSANVVIGAPEFQLTNSSTSPAFVVANSGRAAVVMQNSGSSPSWESWNFTSVATYREQFAITGSWPTTTDASRKARCVVTVYDTAAREALRMEADGARAWAGVPAGNSTSFAKLGGPIFDHHADAGNTNTNGTDDDLYSDTTPASVLGTNDEKLSAWYAGVFVSSATATRQIKIWFAGTAIFDTGALTLSLSAAWTCYVEIIRVSSTVIRYTVSMTTEGAALAAYTATGELTGLTLSGTNILKITGAAAGVGAAASDVLAKAGSVEWKAAA